MNAPDPVAKRVLPVLEPADRRRARRPDREGQDALLRVVRIRARAGHDLHQPVARCPARASPSPYKNDAEELPRPRRRSAVGERSPDGARVALGLGQPVRPRRRRPSVERRRFRRKDATNVARHLVERAQRRQRCRKSRSATTTSTGPTRRSRSMVGTPRVQLPRLDDRRALQLPAARSTRTTSSARYDLNCTRTSTTSRSAASTSTCTTPATGTSSRSAATSSTRVPSNLGAADSGRRRARPVAVEHRGAEPGRRSEFDQNFQPTGRTGRSTCRGRPRRSWFGDNWRVSDQLTVNYGVRWDADPSMASPPDVIDQRDPDQHTASAGRRRVMRAPTSATRPTSATGQQRRAARRLHLQRRRQQRPRDPRRQRPLLRVAGLEHDLQPAGLQPAGHGDASPNDGPTPTSSPIRPAASPPTTSSQARRRRRRSRRASSAPTTEPVHLAEQHRLPEADQQRDRLRSRPDAFNEYRDTRTIDPNLFYNPATGYNRNPARSGRPNPAYGQRARVLRPTATAIRRSCRRR